MSSLHQRAQEEVHSKELKVKLLTDSVNSFIAKAPPTAHDALRSELDVLTANYQRLCSRLDGKCKTLEVGAPSSPSPPPFVSSKTASHGAPRPRIVVLALEGMLSW